MRQSIFGKRKTAVKPTFSVFFDEIPEDGPTATGEARIQRQRGTIYRPEASEALVRKSRGTICVVPACDSSKMVHVMPMPSSAWTKKTGITQRDSEIHRTGERENDMSRAIAATGSFALMRISKQRALGASLEKKRQSKALRQSKLSSAARSPCELRDRDDAAAREEEDHKDDASPLEGGAPVGDLVCGTGQSSSSRSSKPCSARRGKYCESQPRPSFGFSRSAAQPQPPPAAERSSSSPLAADKLSPEIPLSDVQNKEVAPSLADQPPPGKTPTLPPPIGHVGRCSPSLTAAEMSWVSSSSKGEEPQPGKLSGVGGVGGGSSEQPLFPVGLGHFSSATTAAANSTSASVASASCGCFSGTTALSSASDRSHSPEPLCDTIRDSDIGNSRVGSRKGSRTSRPATATHDAKYAAFPGVVDSRATTTTPGPELYSRASTTTPTAVPPSYLGHDHATSATVTSPIYSGPSGQVKMADDGGSLFYQDPKEWVQKSGNWLEQEPEPLAYTAGLKGIPKQLRDDPCDPTFDSVLANTPAACKVSRERDWRLLTPRVFLDLRQRFMETGQFVVYRKLLDGVLAGTEQAIVRGAYPIIASGVLHGERRSKQQVQWVELWRNRSNFTKISWVSAESLRKTKFRRPTSAVRGPVEARHTMPARRTVWGDHVVPIQKQFTDVNLPITCVDTHPIDTVLTLDRLYQQAHGPLEFGGSEPGKRPPVFVHLDAQLDKNGKLVPSGIETLAEEFFMRTDFGFQMDEVYRQLHPSDGIGHDRCAQQQRNALTTSREQTLRSHMWNESDPRVLLCEQSTLIRDSAERGYRFLPEPVALDGIIVGSLGDPRPLLYHTPAGGSSVERYGALLPQAHLNAYVETIARTALSASPHPPSKEQESSEAPVLVLSLPGCLDGGAHPKLSAIAAVMTARHLFVKHFSGVVLCCGDRETAIDCDSILNEQHYEFQGQLTKACSQALAKSDISFKRVVSLSINQVWHGLPPSLEHSSGWPVSPRMQATLMRTRLKDLALITTPATVEALLPVMRRAEMQNLAGIGADQRATETFKGIREMQEKAEERKDQERSLVTDIDRLVTRYRVEVSRQAMDLRREGAPVFGGTVIT